MKKESENSAELQYTLDGRNLTVPNGSRSEFAMQGILTQLREHFKGNLDAATMYNQGCQLVFKEGHIPTEQEIRDAISALDFESNSR